MGRIADAEQPRAIPALEAVDGHGEKLDVIPGGDLADAVGEGRIEAHQRGAKGLQPLGAQPVEAALGNDIGALPIIAAVERDEHHAGLDAAERLLAVIGPLGEAEPQHVHRRAEILDLEAGERAHGGMPAVGAHHQIGFDFERIRSASWPAGLKSCRRP